MVEGTWEGMSYVQGAIYIVGPFSDLGWVFGARLGFRGCGQRHWMDFVQSYTLNRVCGKKSPYIIRSGIMRPTITWCAIADQDIDPLMC